MKSTKWMKLALLAGMLALIILLAGCNPKPDNSGQTGNTGVGTIGDDLFPTFSVGPSGTATPTAVIVTPAIVPPSSESPPISTNAGWPDITLPPGDYPTPTYAPATSVPPMQTPQPTATPAPTSSALRLGSKGDRVRSVQSRLKALGYLKGTVDGDFGKATESALKAFQKRNKLTADGIVGQATIAKLNSPNAIKAQPTASPTPRPTATPRINANTYLRLGSSGSDVRKMQSRLIELGYLEGKATGYFNEATEAAVIAFQKRNVSYSDGVAGPMTLEALYSSKAKRASSFAGIVGTSLKRGMTDSAAVRSMQQKLKSLGYYTGGIDGDFGASTELAVRAFQQQHRIKVDGIAGPRTLTALFNLGLLALILGVVGFGVISIVRWAMTRLLDELSRSLGLLVVAEGVEDDETWERLRDLRCDAVQGWLVAAAMPPDETTAWLLARGSRGWQRPAAALPAATTTGED